MNNAQNSERAKKANAWLRENPFRLQLGRFGLTLLHADGTGVKLAELHQIRQTLDLWTGIIESRFECGGYPVIVQTIAHPKRDLVSVRLESTLVREGRAGLEFEPSLPASNCFVKLLRSPNTAISSRNARDYITATNATVIEATLAFSPTLTPLTDTTIMRGTLDFVLQDWDWKSTWGWDYPVLAMTATRLGRPEDAINALLLDTPKNRFLPNGHNYQRPNLPLYLPGNGALLAAIAIMAAGWDGAPQKNAPGFLDNGQWSVRWEGLKPFP